MSDCSRIDGSATRFDAGCTAPTPFPGADSVDGEIPCMAGPVCNIGTAGRAASAGLVRRPNGTTGAGLTSCSTAAKPGPEDGRSGVAEAGAACA
jgi:hypothetical protein